MKWRKQNANNAQNANVSGASCATGINRINSTHEVPFHPTLVRNASPRTLARSVVFHWVGALAFVFGPHHLKPSANMGILISRLFEGLFGSKEVRILILGLDNAGKTTILYRLQNESDEAVQTIPTIGFNVETLQYKNIKVRQRTPRAGGADGWRRRRRGRPAGGGETLVIWSSVSLRHFQR